MTPPVLFVNGQFYKIPPQKFFVVAIKKYLPDFTFSGIFPFTEAHHTDPPENTMSAITKEIARTAFDARKDAVYGRGWGCARVYIGFSMKLLAADIRMLEAAGFKVTRRPNSTRKFIYFGYDNCTGREYYEAEAVARAFSAAGISAYADADGD